MLGVQVGLAPQYASRRQVQLPVGFGWDQARFPIQVEKSGNGYKSDLDPRALVDPEIWTGAAIHVDATTGNDDNSGLGAFDGDFNDPKRTIYGAFREGNLTGSAYRVIVKPGRYEESAFTRNGNDEPALPVAILGWQGDVQYRTGPFSVNWSDAGGTFSAAVSSVKRAFRTDVQTPQGQYVELTKAPDLATCQATEGTWYLEGGTTHVNVGVEPSADGIALLRGFHGARFLNHSHDIYLENIHCEGGITGGLHIDPAAQRNVIGVRCSFRYAAPSNSDNPLDAVRVRRTDGLVAFFDCDASMGGKDGWSFHEDGAPGMHVLLENCTGHHNGIAPATSCNGFTTHDAVRSIVLGGEYGHSRNGSEVHCIQSSQTWLAGTSAIARDVDGSSVAFKCSNQSKMWLQDTVADAANGLTNYAIEANAGTVCKRDHVTVAGTEATSVGGEIGPF